jgi:nitroimidazol reductase NimA-like FMN-containing flavoprotein (pyridoxamine 5'-phosphate oxidase superfamily)
MSPRESIRMSPAEIDEFLSTRRHVVLATVGSDGAPDATIVPCRYEHGELLLSVDGAARGALAADDRVSCAAEVCSSYYEIRGVTVHGRAASTADVVRVHPETVASFDFGKIRERPE